MRKRIVLVILLFLVLLPSYYMGVKDRFTIVVDIGPYSQVRDSLEAWKASHPKVRIKERRRIRNSDFSSLAVLGQKNMPDLFITDRMTGVFLSRIGRVLDINQYSSPALNENVCLVVSDGEEGDTDYCAETDILNELLADEAGQEWFSHIMRADGKAAFTDSLFVARLTEMQARLRTMQKASVEDFVQGRCHRLLITGDIKESILQPILEQDPARYSQLQFHAFQGEVLPCGFSYGIFMGAWLGRDPEKRNNAISLREAMATKETVPSDSVQILLKNLENSSRVVMIPTHYLTGSFWSTAGRECFSQLAKGDKTIAEYAALLQNAYEQDYLSSLR